MSNATLPPEVMKVIDTWVEPRGFVLCNENTNILLGGIAKRFGNKFSHANLTAVALEDPLGIWAEGFGPKQRAAVWQTWWTQAPKGLIGDPANSKVLFDYIEKFCGGVMSLPNLDRAYEATKSQLQHEKPKTLEQVQREFEQKEYARIQREKQENLDGLKKLNERIVQSEKKEDHKQAEERQQAYKTKLESLIGIFEVYSGPNRVDFSRTNNLKEKFSKVRCDSKGRRIGPDGGVWDDAGNRVAEGGKVDWHATFLVVERMMQAY